MKKKSAEIIEFSFENFEFIKKIQEKFPSAEIYVVGGAVRDLLLGRPSKDYDFVVRGVPADHLEEFLQQLGQVDLVGKSFGVFKFVPQGGDSHNPIDIALPRTEASFGTGGYRDFEIQADYRLSIEDDLSRRDFTINAIALKVNQVGQADIVDPFHGREDLKNQLIRAVGQPEERLKEDYSRMLRALRFACQLGFPIEEKTWQAIPGKMARINDIQRNVVSVEEGSVAEPEVIENRTVPYEVIARELLKSFRADPVRAFDLYEQSGAFQELIPEILEMNGCPQPDNFHHEGDVRAHTRLALEKISSPEFRQQFGDEPASTELIIAALLHDIGKPPTIKTPEKDNTDRIRFNEHDIVGSKMAREICQRLKLSSPEGVGVDAEKVAWLVQHHMILVQGDIEQMRASTIEKYFFNPQAGQDLLRLSFVDIAATVPPSGQPDFQKFNQMLGRIEELKSLSANRKELPKSLLNGHDIMQVFQLKPGRQIGELLTALREEQLNNRVQDREQALAFLQKHLGQ